MQELFTSFIVSVGINVAMFLPAYFLRTDKFTDISYAFTFCAVALYGFLAGGGGYPSLVVLVMIFAWAGRLGGYLLMRIRKIGKDSRFDGMRENFLKFAGFWLLQGITVWVVMIDSSLFFGQGLQSISPYAFIGVAIWLAGLTIEGFADLQKYRFINNPENKGKWIATGLWKYSRHPNYFGEMMVWFGLFVYTAFGLSGWEIVLGFISPLYIACLIIFVSGIPILEKSADQRWGSEAGYQEYKKRTSVLVLLPNRRIS